MKNKVFIITALLMVLLIGFADAAKPKPVITADETYFDINTGLYVLKGNVRIEVRDRVITAEKATVDMANMEVWGTGGIKFKQSGIDFAGGSVYVYGTKKHAKIDGGAKYFAQGLSIIADRAEYNWVTKIAVFNGNVKVDQDGNVWEAEIVSYNLKNNEFINQ